MPDVDTRTAAALMGGRGAQPSQSEGDTVAPDADDTFEDLEVIFPIGGKVNRWGTGPVRVTPKEAAKAIKDGTHTRSEEASAKAAREAARPEAKAEAEAKDSKVEVTKG